MLRLLVCIILFLFFLPSFCFQTAKLQKIIENLLELIIENWEFGFFIVVRGGVHRVLAVWSEADGEFEYELVALSFGGSVAVLVEILFVVEHQVGKHFLIAVGEGSP